MSDQQNEASTEIATSMMTGATIDYDSRLTVTALDLAADPTPPSDLLCPITQEVFRRPVQDILLGHTYERSAILAWLAASGTCPLTRRPMRPSELITNRLMKDKVENWRQQHGLPPHNSDGDIVEDGWNDIVGYVSMSPPQDTHPRQRQAPILIGSVRDDLLEEYDRIISDLDIIDYWQAVVSLTRGSRHHDRVSSFLRCHGGDQQEFTATSGVTLRVPETTRRAPNQSKRHKGRARRFSLPRTFKSLRRSGI